MLAFAFALLSVLSLNLPVSRVWASASSIEPTPFDGRVSRIVYGADARPDGLILDDHTLLEFPAVSLAASRQLAIGDQVSGTGIEVLSAPNRVFDRIRMMRGGQELFDNSKMQYSPPNRLSTALGASQPKMKAITETSPLVAVGAAPDGQVDRIVLAIGVSSCDVQIPSGAYVDPRSLVLGQAVAVQGAGARFPSGDLFIHAFTAQTVGGPWLFRARGYDGEQWMLKEGPIKQALVKPDGSVDGVLLSDDTAIFFTPLRMSQVSALLPGALLKAAGPGVGNRMSADSLLLVGQDRFISLEPALTPAGSRAQRAGEVPRQELIPMKDTARVEAIFKNIRGEPDTIVLADRTRIWIPARLRLSLPRTLAPGKTLAVRGRGGTYAMGTSIEADWVRVRSG